MRIVGYGDRWSVQPDEPIRFMVSCEPPTYRADIVRLIHGDESPEGPGFKEEVISTAIAGDYPGRKQVIRNGSYLIVPYSPVLSLTDSFTLQAWIYPTTPEKGAQGVITKWSDSGGVGYGLFVDQDGGLSLWLGDQGGTVERVSTGTPLRPRQWYFVAGVYDSQNKRALALQHPVSIYPRDETEGLVERDTDLGALGENELPLLIAAHWDAGPPGETTVKGHFNGKIDSPRVFGRALGQDEIELLRQDAPTARFGDAIIADWDFARDFSTSKVTDASTNALHGEAINMPMRAVTGHDWKRKDMDFNHVPDEYGAIYFHDDDLEDACWEVDFEFTVPKDMKSGVYAVRLKAGDDEDYVPFFVRPKKGTSTADIAFLAPTLSYLNYADAGDFGDPYVIARLLDQEPVFTDQPQDEYIKENNLRSTYDLHTDGSGVCYSSRLRPVVSLRPKYNLHWLGAPHQFNADLHLVDWLESKGHRFDVVTDDDLDAEGESLLAPYRVIVTGSHPEYWSSKMLDGLEAYLSNGGRLMYLGGNGFYFVSSYDPERPHIAEVRRPGPTYEREPGEYYHSTTGELGGMWRKCGRPPQRLLGVGCTANGWLASIPYRRQRGSHDPRAAFIFEGIGEDEAIGDFGLCLGGAAGYEMDRADTLLGTPAHTLVLATASDFSNFCQPMVEDFLQIDFNSIAESRPLVRSDMTYFEGPKGGAVFSTSSIAWCASLSHNNYDNNVSRITDNVLRRFAAAEPL